MQPPKHTFKLEFFPRFSSFWNTVMLKTEEVGQRKTKNKALNFFFFLQKLHFFPPFR